MQFWGVEVKNGESIKVTPGDDMVLHLSQACLGEVKKEKGTEPVSLFVKFGDQKLGIGVLSYEKFPQISFDLVFEKEFELSHNWKNGSVFFTGYRATSPSQEDTDYDSFDEDDTPVHAGNVNPKSQVKQAVKPDNGNEHVATLKAEMGHIKKDDKAKQKVDDGDEEDSSESDSGEDEPKENGEAESSEGEDDSDDGDKDNDEDDDESDSEDKETHKKAEASKKRPIKIPMKSPLPEKKAKFVTPQKTDGKKGGHVATPYPSKQTGKAGATNKDQAKQQTPKSGGDYSCKPCNRSFKTEDALQSHNRAKHSAK